MRIRQPLFGALWLLHSILLVQAQEETLQGSAGSSGNDAGTVVASETPRCVVSGAGCGLDGGVSDADMTESCNTNSISISGSEHDGQSLGVAASLSGNTAIVGSVNDGLAVSKVSLDPSESRRNLSGEIGGSVSIPTSIASQFTGMTSEVTLESSVITALSSSALSSCSCGKTGVYLTVTDPSSVETPYNSANETHLTGKGSGVLGSSKASTESASMRSSTQLEPESTDDLLALDRPPEFDSFEEWRQKKLQELGQEGSLENKAKPSSRERMGKSGGAGSADYSVGEELEIDLAFFSNSGEAEGKVYAERFNYASVDCAATIVKTNKEASKAAAILTENKDSYMLNECSVKNKFFIVELCDDILVETVVLANFEFFSSTFRHVRISVSDRFPTTAQHSWRTLGDFQAENRRDLQYFSISNPLIWARYLRVELLSHYGSEFYCPVSLLRVYGKTMIEEFRDETSHISGGDRESGRRSKASKRSEKSDGKSERKPAAGRAESGSPVPGSSQSEDSEMGVGAIDPFLAELAMYLESSVCFPSMPTSPSEVSGDRPSGSGHYGDDTTEEQEEAGDTEGVGEDSEDGDEEVETAGTQESIYKNIMKRLAFLESNATLTFQYFDERAKFAEAALGKLDKRQNKILRSFIDGLNETVVREIEDLKLLYAELKKQALVEIAEDQHAFHEFMAESSQKIGELSSAVQMLRVLEVFLLVFLVFVLGVLLLVVYVFGTQEMVFDEKGVRKYSGHFRNFRKGKTSSFLAFSPVISTGASSMSSQNSSGDETGNSGGGNRLGTFTAQNLSSSDDEVTQRDFSREDNIDLAGSDLDRD